MHHYRRYVKKIVVLVTQNGHFDSSSIFRKNCDFNLDKKIRYSTSMFYVLNKFQSSGLMITMLKYDMIAALFGL